MHSSSHARARRIALVEPVGNKDTILLQGLGLDMNLAQIIVC
jgi:hypothetical protein